MILKELNNKLYILLIYIMNNLFIPTFPVFSESTLKSH